MKENKTILLYYFSALCFFIAAFIYYFNKETSMGTLQLCLASTFLCIGANKKSKK